MELLLRPYQSISPSPRLVSEYFVTKICLHGEQLLASLPNPKPEGHPFSALRDCLFNIFAVIIHIGGLSSIRNLRTRHAVS
jgi:hypothetical protein